MSEKERSTFSATLLIGTEYLEWLKTGGVAGHNPGESNTATPNQDLVRNFEHLNGVAFVRSLEALASLEEEDEAIEDFSGILTPTAVGKLPQPSTSMWRGSLEHYHGLNCQARRNEGVCWPSCCFPPF